MLEANHKTTFANCFTRNTEYVSHTYHIPNCISIQVLTNFSLTARNIVQNCYFPFNNYKIKDLKGLLICSDFITLWCTYTFWAITYVLHGKTQDASNLPKSSYLTDRNAIMNTMVERHLLIHSNRHLTSIVVPTVLLMKAGGSHKTAQV